jgi:hypothetical protein
MKYYLQIVLHAALVVLAEVVTIGQDLQKKNISDKLQKI